MPVLPLRDVVVYPHMVIPLFVGRDKSILALDEAMRRDKQVLLVAQKQADVDDPKGRDLYTVGTVATILQLLKLPDGTVKVLVEGVARAMVENIVRRAKKLAIKRAIAGEGKGIRTEDLLASIKQEYKEHEDLPNTTNPDDWAKISGKKGERIVYVRTLLSEGKDATGGRAIERVGTGQYL